MIQFSIVIPLYNKESVIAETMNSVLSQAYPLFEVVVVNDGSTDDSIKVVESYADKRIRIINKSNGGVSSARNCGIEAVNNDWIIPLDADDLMLPEALGVYARMIESYPKERYFSGRTIWREKDVTALPRIRRTSNPFFRIWMKQIDPAPRNIVFHKTLYTQFGGYDLRQSFYEDWQVSLNLAKFGSMVYTDTYLAKYTPDDNGLASRSHPIEKEMAYYIPEQIATASFWHKALLYENIEMEILWWHQHGNEANVKFYQDMQKQYFSWIFKALHWVRQKMIRKGFI